MVNITLTLSGCSGSSGNNASGEPVSISGTIRYEDKEYSRSGFTGNTALKAVRYAVVDLVDYNDVVVASTLTDSQGDYHVTGAGINLRVRVLAETGQNVGARITIHDYDGNVYAVSRDVTGSGDLIVDVDVITDNDISGAFNMLDVFTAATEYITSFSTALLPAVNTYWAPKRSRYGTYFCPSRGKGGPCPQGKGIYILGGGSSGGDTDQYDDDVLYHEYGHYIESAINVHDSPGGIHYLTENDQDLRLAWSEGWGGFFPLAVKSWLQENNDSVLSIAEGLAPTYFVDTYGSGVGISIDMANPNPLFCPSRQDCFVYSSSEIAVIKVLNSLLSEFGMQAIWDVYANYMARGTSLPATLETFWDGWLQQRAPAADEMDTLKRIFSERLVFYQEDRFEADNTITALRKMSVCQQANCEGEKHYLFQGDLAVDKDLIAFDAKVGSTYRIETINLSNGADTYLRVLDANGSQVFDLSGQILANDDRPGTVYCGAFDNPCRIHNNDVMLSSVLSFAPSATDTYYVEVTTSLSKPAAAGRYGTYTLQITAE
ncbi:MAG: hypothetical protein GXP08_13075 [Gammaproteobacteria bacterium]|nr:hypothetical protein [Gammaproteobacteria bacterium]